MNQPNQPLVSILTVNWNQPGHTIEMLKSLAALDYPSVEIILVDNGSEHGQAESFEALFPQVKVIRSGQNLGFAGGNNLGMAYCKGKYILLLNNDTIVPNHLLTKLVHTMEQHPQCGAVSPKIYFYDKPQTLQYAGTTGIHFLTGRGKKIGYGLVDEGQFEQSGLTVYPNGACMMVRAELFKSLGGLPEHYFLYYEEHDLAEQMKRAGYEIRFEAQTFIHHKISASSGKSSPLKTYYLFRNRLIFIKRNLSGLKKGLALAYGMSITFTLHMLRHLIKGELAHAWSLVNGLAWHFQSDTSNSLR